MQYVLQFLRIMCLLGCSGCVIASFGVVILPIFQPMQLSPLLIWRNSIEHSFQFFILWVIGIVGCCWGYAITERLLHDQQRWYQIGVSLVLLVLFVGWYVVATGIAMFFLTAVEQEPLVLNISLLLVIVNTASFNAIYWQFNHLLNLWKGIAYRLSGNPVPEHCVERPFDVWMGLAMFLCSSGIPLLMIWGVSQMYLATAVADMVSVLIITITTIVVMILLGLVRGLQSMSAIMWMGMHNLIFAITLLMLVPQLPNISQCVAQSMIRQDDIFTVTAACVSLSQFWFDKWLTTIFAFIAIFGAALLASYSVDIKKLGWKSHELQYQNLAFVFSLSAIIILVESVILLGIPLMNDILSVKSF